MVSMPVRAAALAAFSVYASAHAVHAQGQPRWYKGNTHMHSTRSDGELATGTAAKWYNDNEYDYLVLTDHRVFAVGADLVIPNKRSDFLVVTGEEFNSNTGYGDNHATVINAQGALGDILSGATTVWEHFNRIYKLVEAKKGLAFINHPTWSSLVSASDLMKIEGFRHFELFNGAQDTDNYGIFSSGMPPLEGIWDTVLTRGAKYYGVGADDMHKFTLRPSTSNPMTGFTMLRASSLDVEAIQAAYRKGDFYATNGVMLKECDSKLGLYRVAADGPATLKELARRDNERFANPARPVKTGTPGFRIDFIGPNGKVVKAVLGDTGSFQVTNDLAYVRARVTYLRNITASSAPYENHLKQRDYIAQNGMTKEEYYAWGQPYFTDARREGPALVFGCTDATYFEFDAKANVMQPGACKNKNTSIRFEAAGTPDGAWLLRVAPEWGSYTVRILALDGKVLRVLPGNAARAHRLEGLARHRTFGLEIRGEGGRLWRTLRRD